MDDFASVDSWHAALKETGGLYALRAFLNKVGKRLPNPRQAAQWWENIQGDKSSFPERYSTRAFKVALVDAGRAFLELSATNPCGACGVPISSPAHWCKACGKVVHDTLECPKVIVYCNGDLFCNESCRAVHPCPRVRTCPASSPPPPLVLLRALIREAARMEASKARKAR